ncbi:MAG: hypothetical protein ACFFD1_12510 [Candidatus Thorarchaeota archaeon]
MSDNTATILYRLVNDQLVAKIKINSDSQSQDELIYIATDGISLFFYSQINSKIFHKLQNNPSCTIIFNEGIVRGKCKIIQSTDTRFHNYFKALDQRYLFLKEYKKNKEIWNVLIVIDPENIEINK